MTNPNSSNMEPLTRTQILVVMGVTAIILLVVAKVWQRLGSILLLKIHFSVDNLLFGVALAGVIIVASSIIYRLWPDYRKSADSYLELVLKPLI